MHLVDRRARTQDVVDPHRRRNVRAQVLDCHAVLDGQAGAPGERIICRFEQLETAQQLALLRELGCDDAQGYYLSRPASAEDLGPWLVDAAVGIRV